MASTLKVNTIQHSGGTSAVSIDSAGQVSLPNTTMIQQWMLTGNISGNDTVLTTWVTQTIASQVLAKAGPSMTHSSGVFTFPKTGLYRVFLNLMTQTGASQDNYVNVRIQLSTDSGSSFSIIKEAVSGGPANVAAGMGADVLINVTNTSTHQVNFKTASMGGQAVIIGNNANTFSYTTATFERLTDAQS